MSKFSKKQMAERRTGIGSSEIAAVAGLNPWSSALDVWQTKVGKTSGDGGSYHTERGDFLEAGVRKWMAHRLGVRIKKTPCMMRHPNYHFIYASADGVVVDEDRVVAAVEIKCPDYGTYIHWGDPSEQIDGIPEYIIPQVIWECEVLRVKKCYVGALIRGNVSIYCVEHSSELFEALLKKAEMFWGYVERGELLPPDFTGSSGAWTKQYPKVNSQKDFITSDYGIESQIFEYKKVYAELKEIAERKDVLQNIIKAAIGDAPGLCGPWGRISWKTNKAGRRTFRARWEDC